MPLSAAMDPDEAEIYANLKSLPGQFVSAREICRRAGGKWRYREDEKWAMPVLRRMIEKSFVEADTTGHFRLFVPGKQRTKEQQRWISPELSLILRQSGKNFGVIELDEELDSDDLVLTETPSSQTTSGNPSDSEDN